MHLRHAYPHRVGVIAGWLGVTAFVALAAVTRLANLDAFAGKFDEGIRGAQLMLMVAGFRPFRDIFASQGPLSLDIFFPTFALFGQTLGAARMAPALLSVVGLLVIAGTTRHLVGSVGAAIGALVLLLSPTYLKNSRLALVEVPALVPAAAAVGAALAYGRDGDRRWLVTAGVLAGLALAIKPMVAPALVPIGLAILLRGRGVLAGGLLFGGSLLAVVAVTVLWAGPAEVYDQMFRFRLASRRVEGWSLAENWAAMAGELVDEGLVPYVAAVGAAALLLAIRPRLAAPIVAWPLASFGLLMAYSPLQFKHAVIMLPPLALLIGVGAGVAWDLRSMGAASRGRRAALTWAVGATALVLAAGYVASLPRIVELDRRLIAGLPEARPESFEDEIDLIPRLTGPADYVLVDEPAVAFAARRLVPPSLVDTSMVRIRSRSIDAGDAVAAAERFDVKLLFLYSDGLRSIRGFGDWVDAHFVAVKINERRNGKDRALYLRQDADLAAARSVLGRSLTTADGVTFAGQLRLIGSGVDRTDVRPGGAVGVTLGWEAAGPVAADYAVVTVLRDARGQVVEQNQRGLGGGGEGTASWEPGRWTVRTSTLSVPSRTPPGDYGLYVGVYDSKARALLPLDGVPGATDVPLTTVRVRP